MKESVVGGNGGLLDTDATGARDSSIDADDMEPNALKLLRKKGVRKGRNEAEVRNKRNKRNEPDRNQIGTERNRPARHGTARHGTARHGTARHGTARHGTARQVPRSREGRKEVYAHRCILMARSEYFERMFQSGMMESETGGYMG
jgi:hypothetical protein